MQEIVSYFYFFSVTELNIAIIRKNILGTMLQKRIFLKISITHIKIDQSKKKKKGFGLFFLQ